MNILDELYAILTNMGFSVETGVFSDKAPDEYIIITPMVDNFPIFADNYPLLEKQEARLSLYSKKNYLISKKQVVKTLIGLGFTITGQIHLGREDDTSYFHAAIDVEKCYEF